MNRLHTIVLNTCLTGAVAALAAGCSDQPKQPAYGSQTMQSAPPAMTPTTPPPLTVPPGASPLASGAYEQIQFKVPDESGLLYIFDQDTNTVKGTTNSIASDGGKSMSMADLGHTVQGLSTTDHYRIYFAPMHPTTQPIGGPGM